MEAGILYVFRGKRGQAMVSGFFLVASLVVATYLLAGNKSWLNVDELVLSQQIGITAIAAMVFVPLLVETTEPFFALVPLRSTIAVRRLLGISAAQLFWRRLGFWLTLFVIPLLTLVIGSLGWTVGLSVGAIGLVLVIAIGFYVFQLLRRWARVANKEWSEVDETIVGSDVIAVGIESYGVSVAAGALMAFTVWLIDSEGLGPAIGYPVAALFLAGLFVLVRNRFIDPHLNDAVL